MIPRRRRQQTPSLGHARIRRYRRVPSANRLILHRLFLSTLKAETRAARRHDHACSPRISTWEIPYRPSGVCFVDGGGGIALLVREEFNWTPIFPSSSNPPWGPVFTGPFRSASEHPNRQFCSWRSGPLPAPRIVATAVAELIAISETPPAKC